MSEEQQFNDRSGITDEVIDFSDTPDDLTVPDGLYTVRATQIGPDYTDKGCKRIKVILRVEEPAEFENRVIFDQFVLGTEADPDGIEKETRKRFPWVQFKKFIKACGTSTNVTSQNDLLAQLQGQRLNVVVAQETWQGVVRAKVKTYAAIGELQPSAANGAASAAPRTAAAARAVAGGEGYE